MLTGSSNVTLLTHLELNGLLTCSLAHCGAGVGQPCPAGCPQVAGRRRPPARWTAGVSVHSEVVEELGVPQRNGQVPVWTLEFTLTWLHIPVAVYTLPCVHSLRLQAWVVEITTGL